MSRKGSFHLAACSGLGAGQESLILGRHNGTADEESEILKKQEAAIQLQMPVKAEMYTQKP